MRNPTVVQRVVLLELDTSKHAPSFISKEQLYEWLFIPRPHSQGRTRNPIKTQLMTDILHQRLCHTDTPLEQPSFVSISEQLQITTERARDNFRRALFLLSTYPQLDIIERSKVLKEGTKLYVELFGCDLSCCEGLY